MECSGVKYGVEWRAVGSGVEWSGVKSAGVERNRMNRGGRIRVGGVALSF